MHLKAVRWVFDGREDYHARINDESLGIDEFTLLFIRGAGPIGYPGGGGSCEHAATGCLAETRDYVLALHR